MSPASIVVIIVGSLFGLWGTALVFLLAKLIVAKRISHNVSEPLDTQDIVKSVERYYQK